jgi:TolB-like protein/DNA-binding winged helix-turn-helix (wHTH) protein
MTPASKLARTRVLKFGVFEVDLEARELRKSGLLLKLAPQHFQVLQLLLERAQQIVTREELQQRIWPKDTFVDYDLALKKAVNRLREVLGDSAESPRFIETIPRRGYRFIATVEGGATEARFRERAFTRSRWLGWTAAVVCFAALLSALFGLNAFRVRDRLLGRASVPNIQSLAVLPLTNLSADPAQEYFSDGMTDALISELSQMGAVKVISRTSIMGYKKTNKRLPEIARELKVDGIIEGTVQRSGDRVRITAQLIQSPSDKHLWAASYERDLRDVFALERDVTQEIARQIRARVADQDQLLLVQRRRPVSPKVLEAYLQGKYLLSIEGRGFGDEGQKEAQKYFQQAIDADPNYAPAYLGLADAHCNLLWPSSEDTAITRKMVERAAELDPESSDARVSLAWLKIHDWDWRGGEQELRRAIALNPNNVDAHNWLGCLLDALRRLDEGWKEYQIAQELDPKNDHLSRALNLRGERDRAIAMLLIFLKREPDSYLHMDLHCIYEEKGMYKEAVQELERAATLFGSPEMAANIHRGFAASGYRGAMRQTAAELEHLQATKHWYVPLNLAQTYAALGDKDRAFYWLEEAFQHHDILAASPGIELLDLNADRRFDSLRSDPRFTDLLRRVGLPP